ncbi:hypothetical protein GCM10022221_66280 [Actinocorallia aurea]
MESVFHTRISNDIAERGWALICKPSIPLDTYVSYSVGLPQTLRLPDLVLLGVGPSASLTILGALVDASCSGVDVLDRAAVFDALGGRLGMARPAVQLMPVDASWLRDASLFAEARDYGGGLPAAMHQVVIADPEGRFPWQPGCAQVDVARLWQPR